MRKYETVIILRPTLDGEGIKAVIEKFKNLIAAKGNVTKVDEWGKRTLAYEVKDFNEGYYVCMEFEGETDHVKEIERNYKISEDIIRYIIVKEEE